MKTPAAFTRLWVRRPLFILAIGMVATIVTAIWKPGFEWLVALGFAALLGVLGNWKTGFAGGLSTLAAICHFHWQQNRQAADESWLAGQGLETVEARLIEDAVGEPGNWSATARIHGTGFTSRKVNWLGSGEPAPAGTEFRATGVFKSIEPERNPGSLDRAARMRAERICGSFRASEMRISRWTGPVSMRLSELKNSFRKSIVAGLDDGSSAAMVIRAVVLGEKSPDSIGLVRDFRESGTLHVFTVSGLHVAMVGSIAWFFLKLAGCPRRIGIPFIVTTMFGYAWLAGSGPAAIRAACMGAVFLGAFTFRRRSDLLNALGAVLMLGILWNPSLIRLPGVQLSYGVVAAIGIGAVVSRRCFDWIAEKEELLPQSELSWWQSKWLGFRQKLAEGFAVSLAASIGSAPLAVFHFGIITPVSVLATVALVVQVYGLLSVALLSAMIHPLSPATSKFLNRQNATLADACSATAGTFASIPGAWAMVNRPEKDTLLIYDLEYGAEAACFANANGNAVMIDSGGKFSLRREIGISLKNLGMNPDSVIFTHADSGHVAPADLLTQMFPIRQVALGMDNTRASIAGTWESEGSGKFEIIYPKKGDLLDLGGKVHAEVVLSPHSHPVGSVADDRTLVLMVHWKDWRILWLGDAGRLSEQHLLESREDIRADLIVAGSHESDFSLTDPFLEAVDPRAIIIPRFPGSRMDAYRSEQVKKWQDAPFKVIDRKTTGGLTITDEDGRLLIEGFLDGSLVRLKPPANSD